MTERDIEIIKFYYREDPNTKAASLRNLFDPGNAVVPAHAFPRPDVSMHRVKSIEDLLAKAGSGSFYVKRGDNLYFEVQFTSWIQEAKDFYVKFYMPALPDQALKTKINTLNGYFSTGQIYYIPMFGSYKE